MQLLGYDIITCIVIQLKGAEQPVFFGYSRWKLSTGALEPIFDRPFLSVIVALRRSILRAAAYYGVRSTGCQG